MPKRGEKERPSKRPGRSGVQINTSLDEHLHAAMLAFIESHNATDEHPASIRSTVEAALRAYLAPKGFWPWPRPPGKAT